MLTPQQFHDAEINGSIAWFHDTGWTVKLGDELNGFDAEAQVGSYAEAIAWLAAKAKELYGWERKELE